MELRAATPADIDAVRSVARESLVASYGHAVDAALLDGAVEEWYDAGDLSDDIGDDNVVFPVAVVDGTVVGFAESYVAGRRERVGEVDWLHVHPDHRGSGIGSALLERVEAALRSADVDRIEARVLADNEAGTEFYEQEGYELAGERDIDIAGETFDELEYRKQTGPSRRNLPRRPTRPTATAPSTSPSTRATVARVRRFTSRTPTPTTNSGTATSVVTARGPTWRSTRWTGWSVATAGTVGSRTGGTRPTDSPVGRELQNPDGAAGLQRLFDGQHSLFGLAAGVPLASVTVRRPVIAYRLCHRLVDRRRLPAEVGERARVEQVRILAV